jgi:hypothetical protein
MTTQDSKVSDIQLAAYLLAMEQPLLRVEGNEGRKVFVFSHVPEEVAFAYYQGRDIVSARKLFGAYRDLKGLTRQAM